MTTRKKIKVNLMGGPADGLVVQTMSDHIKVTVPGGKRAIYRPKTELDMNDAGIWMFDKYEDRN